VKIGDYKGIGLKTLPSGANSPVPTELIYFSKPKVTKADISDNQRGDVDG